MVSEIKGCDATFADPNRKASAHYGIGSEGEIHQYVKDEHIAYHAGNWEANEDYIGIEHAGGYELSPGKRKKPSDECHHASIELITNLCRKFGINELIRGKNIFKHNEVSDSPTMCCGSLDIDLITNEVNKKLKNNTQQPMPNNQPSFHLQNENDLNEWIKKWGMARMSELGMPVVSQEELRHYQNQLTEKIRDYDNINGQLLRVNSENNSLKQENAKMLDTNKQLAQSIQDGDQTEEVMRLNRTIHENNKEYDKVTNDLRKTIINLQNENTGLKAELTKKSGFSLNALIEGIARAKNPLGNTSYMTFLTFALGYLGQLKPESNSAMSVLIGIVTLVVSLVLQYLRNLEENDKKTLKTV